MNSFAHELGVPGNHSFVALLELRLACAPIVVEYLFLSHFAHDQSLIRYIASFPGSLWPDLSRIPATTLYILWSPLHDKVYAGRTINFVRRHLDYSGGSPRISKLATKLLFFKSFFVGTSIRPSFHASSMLLHLHLRERLDLELSDRESSEDEDRRLRRLRLLRPLDFLDFCFSSSRSGSDF